MDVEGFDGYPLPSFMPWVMRTKLGACFSILAQVTAPPQEEPAPAVQP